jgi:HSP20 family protein
MGQEFGSLADLHDEMDRLFSDFARSIGWPRLRESGAALAEWPATDIQENGDEIVVSVDVPGMDEKDVSVELQNGKLTIRGAKRTEREEKKGSYLSRERHYGSVYRSIQLPCDVDASKVSAEFKNGVITVKLPKPEELKQEVKHIEVKRAA